MLRIVKTQPRLSVIDNTPQMHNDSNAITLIPCSNHVLPDVATNPKNTIRDARQYIESEIFLSYTNQ